MMYVDPGWSTLITYNYIETSTVPLTPIINPVLNNLAK